MFRGSGSRFVRYMSNHGSVMKLEYLFLSRSTTSLCSLPARAETVVECALVRLRGHEH
jgi:hypothetical protein